MLRVGLSGGIGSGKSTVARRLAEHGAVVIDADALAREVVAPGTDGLAALVQRFGEEVLDDSGALNRSALAARAFRDEEARADLNAITHPRIGELTRQRMAEAPDDAVVVHDMPLLVESGTEADYHLVVVVDAPEGTRVQRLVERGLDAADARARIRAQATTEQRRAAADVWLDNTGTAEELRTAADEVHEHRLRPFERNVRLHRGAAPGPPRLVEPDPAWPQQARRLAARIRKAAGELALRVDHVGSTPVGELPARDVLDLQLTAGSPEQAERLADPLAAAGFPPVGAAGAGARLHAAADPQRPVHLRVAVRGAEQWWFALLLPEWLRAFPDERAQYAALKRRLAERYAADADGERYAAAKESWFAETLVKVRRWTAETGRDVPAPE
ncbi:dephospho-CoA kinase [Salinifilum ghardaiensis]